MADYSEINLLASVGGEIWVDVIVSRVEPSKDGVWRVIRMAVFD